MTVQSITVTDAQNNVSSYAYSDATGDASSITSTPGLSDAYRLINKKSTAEVAQERWNGLSTNAKIGIGCGIGGAFALLVIVYTVVCVTQRKKGRMEREKADREWNEHTNELMEYRAQMAKGQFAVSHMGHGEKF